MFDSVVLPAGYTRLEYVAFEQRGSYTTAYSYIDPQISFRGCNEIRAVADIHITAFNGRTGNGGNSSGHIWFGLAALNQYCFGVGNTDTDGGDDRVFYDWQRHVWEYSYNFGTGAGQLKVDDVFDKTAVEKSEYVTTFIIGAIYDGTGVPDHTCTQNVYRFQIFLDGELVRDFIPCKNSAEDIGLYDVVNDVFYTPKGNPLHPPIEEEAYLPHICKVEGAEHNIHKLMCKADETLHGVVKGKISVGGTIFDVPFKHKLTLRRTDSQTNGVWQGSLTVEIGGHLYNATPTHGWHRKFELELELGTGVEVVVIHTGNVFLTEDGVTSQMEGIKEDGSAYLRYAIELTGDTTIALHSTDESPNDVYIIVE